MSASDANFYVMTTFAAVEFFWVMSLIISNKELRTSVKDYQDAAGIRRRNVETLTSSVSSLRSELAKVTSTRDDLIEENNDFTERFALIRHACDLSFPLSYKPVTPDDDE